MAKTKFDVICVGSATVDAFAKTQHSELIKIYREGEETDFLAYPTGAKILLDEIDFTTGGGGTNVSVSLARLGLRTAYIGCIGSGQNAEMVLSDLRKEKVDTSLVVKKDGETGYSIILDSIEHDRTILAYKGVNNSLAYKDIVKKRLSTRWFYFSSMMDAAFATLESLAAFAQKNNIPFAFNPSPYLAEKGSAFLQQVLSRAAMLVLNKEEAELIVGKGDFAFLCTKLSQLGPKYVVVTDGKAGSHCFADGVLYFSDTTNVNAVETTGAGDAFASAFLAGIIIKNDISFALALGTTNAESVISYYGAKNKLLSFREATALMKRRPVRVTRKRIH